jgi:hypothetical protein
MVISNGLSPLIKEELLLFLVLSPSLEDHVSSTEHLNHSVEWKLRNNIEWSINLEAKFFIESLCLYLVSLVNIKNCPLLVSSIVISENTNLGSFLVLASNNFKNLVVTPIDELIVLVLEYLPPY